MSQTNKWLNCWEMSSNGWKIYHKAHFVDDKLAASSGNEYELGYFVHFGGNGSIYTCRDNKKTRLAAKFMHVLDDQRRARFDFECHVLAQLNHPH